MLLCVIIIVMYVCHCYRILKFITFNSCHCYHCQGQGFNKNAHLLKSKIIGEGLINSENINSIVLDS